ncbi:hypothetical protein CH063_10637 [Colletotrichum higginsianum]|uniref:Zn(2)-C6 fungal-type domain-containing protein n=1 Tax=Colletotrichum higginsianum (strain IMI 349063) TaxID=759273 RepID=H1VI83_COLHI|nr:hypothetical protein CH063_10637 [Colletotrichum higginsianum]
MKEEGANVAVNHLGLPRDEKHRLSLIDEAETIRQTAPEDSPTGELMELAGDVTDPNTSKALVGEAAKRWGGLDIFVANAGIFKPAEFLTLEKEVFDKTIHVNINGAFYSCQAAANQMVKQGRGGSIIGISSISALQGGGLQTHYTPTKAAVLSMIQSMAVALAKHRIRCNALLPGTIHTQLAEEDMQNEQKRKYLQQRIPMGVGKPHDLAGPAVFLGCEQLSGFMTGSQVLVDGGMYTPVTGPGAGLRNPGTPGRSPVSEMRGLLKVPRMLDSPSVLQLNLVMRSHINYPTWEPIMGAEDEQTERYFTRGRLSRGRGLRNTTGCATCRRRHVKCDEKKPVCGGCERTKRTCAYSGPSQSRSPSPSPSGRPPVINDVTGQISSPLTTGGEPGEPLLATATLASGNPSGDVSRDERIHASYNDAVASAPALQPQSAVPSAEDPPCTTGATPHDPALTSSSLGANLENATAIWVDLLLQDASMQQLDFSGLNFQADAVDLFGSSVVVHSPAVGRSSQNNTGDGPSPTLYTSHPYLHERAPNLDEYQRLEKQAWKSASPLPILPQEHKVFQNFVLHMDLFEPSRPFGTLVPQLAMRNVGLMNAILALSARHLSLGTSPDGKDAQDTNDALRYYYKTLHYIQEAMQYDTYKTSLELLATSSIVSAYEMLDGSRQDWERHLKGVFCIQRSQGIHGDSLGLKQAVWWAWLCQDVWAAFRERRRPFTFWRPLRTLDELDPHELAARSVYFFAQVVAFCSREETERGREDPLARIAAAEALKDTLEDWRRHLTSEFQPLPFAGSPEDVFEPIWINPPAFAVAFQVYYCSHILLLLHVPALGGLDEYTKQRKRLMECVRRVCGIGMTSTDYPSSFMSSQCLFIAGLPLENSRERSFVLELLEAHRLRSGWPIKPLGEELKARWEASDV